MTELEKYTDMQKFTKKIIIDHLHYECSINAFKFMNPNNTDKDIEEMTFRKNISEQIKKKDTYLAFTEIIKKFKIDEKLMMKLGKLSFIDLVSNKKTSDAINFANKHLKNENIDFQKIFTLIGYDSKGIEEYLNLFDDLDRIKICKEINNDFFYMIKKRKCSLLELTLEYYQTLVNIQNKIK